MYTEKCMGMRMMHTEEREGRLGGFDSMAEQARVDVADRTTRAGVDDEAERDEEDGDEEEHLATEARCVSASGADRRVPSQPIYPASSSSWR